MAKLDKIKSLLGTLAPSIATALGGPLAGMAVGTLSKALLGDPATGQTDPAKIENAVLSAADPAVYASIRKADQDFQALMDQHGIDLEKVAQADRDSARQMQVQVKSNLPPVLAVVVTLVCLVAEGWIISHGIPAGVDPVIVGRVLGTLDSALMLILSYYFGSSAGSDRKTELMAGAGDKK